MIKKLIQYFPTIGQFIRNMRSLLDQHSPSRMTPFGFTLAGHKEMAAGTFEPQETMLVRKLLQEVDMLVNVGANVGYYVLQCLSLGKPVIAVEPIDRNLFYLLKNIHDNGWANQVQVFPVALGREVDILQMWGGGTGASLVKGWASNPESWVTKVPVLSLDRVIGRELEDKRALILVDIEGSELQMLLGSANTLNNTPHPIWLVEISTTEHQPMGTKINPNFGKTFEIFFDYGYHAFTADEVMQEITKETIAQIVEGSYQLKTHNFVFR